MQKINPEKIQQRIARKTLSAQHSAQEETTGPSQDQIDHVNWFFGRLATCWPGKYEQQYSADMLGYVKLEWADAVCQRTKEELSWALKRGRTHFDWPDIGKILGQFDGYAQHKRIEEADRIWEASRSLPDPHKALRIKSEYENEIVKMRRIVG